MDIYSFYDKEKREKTTFQETWIIGEWLIAKKSGDGSEYLKRISELHCDYDRLRYDKDGRLHNKLCTSYRKTTFLRAKAELQYCL